MIDEQIFSILVTKYYNNFISLHQKFLHLENYFFKGWLILPPKRLNTVCHILLLSEKIKAINLYEQNQYENEDIL